MSELEMLGALPGRRASARRQFSKGRVALALAFAALMLATGVAYRLSGLEPLGTLPSGRAPAPRRRSKRRVALAVVFAALMLATATAYRQKDQYSGRFADLSRGLIGDENTARVEGWYFYAQDQVDQLKFRVFGGSVNPFSTSSASATEASVAVPYTQWNESNDEVEWPPYVPPPPPPPPMPAPLELPETRQLLASLAPGEGVWTTAGLPRTSPDEPLMVKTFLRPDAARPYAVVGVLLLDKRRFRLHIVGGTEDPGGDRGVKGPGVLPQADRPALLAAWNGGFKGPHGGYGMYADGKTYRPLLKGLASVALYKDGTIKIGEWGRDLAWSDDLAAVRQNAVLLVDNCEVSKRTNEGNNTWGYVQVNSAEFITWRSAIGLTRNGDLLVASGNSLSAASLARALWAAGACYAMQLDINTPYVLTSLYFPQADGSVKAGKFMDSMVDGPGRFFTTQPRDFMYATLDQTNYVP